MICKTTFRVVVSVVLLFIASSLVFRPAGRTRHSFPNPRNNHAVSPLVEAIRDIIATCHALSIAPGPPDGFHSRAQSDRFEAGIPPVLIKNATIWTGRHNGTEILTSTDIFLNHGIIRALGNANGSITDSESLQIINASGAWLTPGLVDLHSHLGVGPLPLLSGAIDVVSFKGLAMPWLRSVDGINTHDDTYALSISGGVTSANILPGSADAIGGQAFTIKLRPTVEKSTSAMLLESPFELTQRPRWRHIKHACGMRKIRAGRIHEGTRMDTQWAFREAYETARKIKSQQDEYCDSALAALGEFPHDLEWEALVDVLRGRVKVHVHCYEAVDLDNMVRLTEEFKFPIAAFHHAQETYLAPDLIKKSYGSRPAAALFATSMGYTRETYRGSEFAARILDDNGIDVVMKSDHAVLDSRYLLFEAQQAYYFGLRASAALSAVTSTPARVLGLDHRIGYIEKGFDADVVLWDRYPLRFGATPQQVFIDGIAQFPAGSEGLSPYAPLKAAAYQRPPKTPDFEAETRAAVEYDGLPSLDPSPERGRVAFVNVEAMYVNMSLVRAPGVVVVDAGRIVCYGLSCDYGTDSADAVVVDLEGGWIGPGLATFGSPLGLGHMFYEKSTNDGTLPNRLNEPPSAIVGGGGTLTRASDGLQFASRDMLIALRACVTTGIVAPQADGFLAGLSTAFRTSAPHKLADGAVIQDVVAMHVALSMSAEESVSTQIAALRTLLLRGGSGDLGARFAEVSQGKLPLVVTVSSADIMASLIALKTAVEARNGGTMHMVFVGAQEAHLLAPEIAAAGVGVILVPARVTPLRWESRRIHSGPPLTPSNAAGVLRAHNVTIALGVEEGWQAQHTRLEAAWAAQGFGEGEISQEEMWKLVSTNLERLLGIEHPSGDLVATRGGSPFEMEARAVAVISSLQGEVDLLI
ncbi:hypothetical protein FISHEDRAFT_33245 [Fistulina hepatica ATCC 64428]|uniref:Amidohydrolase-related domain-containing protein n=1 Tax=Fistulina hepatica ATCC 64428 TaxID=1128425 RepID=A0A0D7ANU2_9AGAR|nr:hypothetical protein FISHEDRAFT_33245 [Fistulina hepatica ATCC 64428]